MKRIVDSKQAQTQKLIKRADVPIALGFFSQSSQQGPHVEPANAANSGTGPPPRGWISSRSFSLLFMPGPGFREDIMKMAASKVPKRTKVDKFQYWRKTYHYSLSHIGTKQHQTTRNGIGGGSSKSLQAMSFCEILMLSLLSMNWNEASTRKYQVMVIFTRILPKNL